MSAIKGALTSLVLVAMASLGLDSQAIGQERGRAPGVGERGRGAAEVRGLVKAVDAKAGTITLASGGGREQAPTETTYQLAKDVEVAAGIALGRGAGVFKEAKLADLVAGVSVSLTLSADKKTVESILADEPTVRARLKAVDAAKNTVTVLVDVGRGREAGPEEKTYTVAKDAEVAVDDGRGRSFSIKEAKLADLGEGALVTLRLSVNKSVVHGILAEGRTVSGIVKELDAGKKSLSLVIRPARGDDGGETLNLIVSDDAAVLLDSGKGRRLSIKVGKLADVPVGSLAMARLTPDQQFVMLLRVQGPEVTGLLKGVDAGKGTITVAIPKGRGEDPEEKTFTLAKNARIMVDGAESGIANLKVADDGPMVQLRLSLDQTAVQSVQARQAGRR